MEHLLLDTDKFSEILRTRDASISQKSETYLTHCGRFTLSVISISELIDGFHRRGLQSHIDQLVARMQSEDHEILSLTFESAKLAGVILGDLHRAGQTIGRADPFIALIPIQTFPLVTGNSLYFERIQALGYSLKLDNWQEPSK